MIKYFVVDNIHPNRGELFPLLKPFIKGEGFTDVERQQIYGISEKDWSEIHSVEEADVLILPMSWNYYSKHKKISRIIELLSSYKPLNKPIWSFTSGDYGVQIPRLNWVTVFRANGNRSKLEPNHHGMPVFINDPLKAHFNKTEPQIRPYHPEPTIGFCGQADGGIGAALKDIVRIAWRNLRYYIGIRKELPQPIFSTTHLRARLLDTCERTNGIRTHFIRRKKYRAGVHTPEDRKRTTQEFYDNIKDSDYTLCVRGGGNFSVRLYETLAMGRIPVLVDTDCLLPFKKEIDWKKHVVLVSFNERHLIGEKIYKFHVGLNADKFKRLQQFNRQFWTQNFSLNGFFQFYTKNL